MKQKEKTNVGRNSWRNPKRLFLIVFTLLFINNMAIAGELKEKSTVMERIPTSPQLQHRLDGLLHNYQTFSYLPRIADEVRGTGRIVLELEGKQ